MLSQPNFGYFKKKFVVTSIKCWLAQQNFSGFNKLLWKEPKLTRATKVLLIHLIFGGKNQIFYCLNNLMVLQTLIAIILVYFSVNDRSESYTIWNDCTVSYNNTHTEICDDDRFRFRFYLCQHTPLSIEPSFPHPIKLKTTLPQIRNCELTYDSIWHYDESW